MAWRRALKREGKAQRYHAPAPVASEHVTYMVRFVKMGVALRLATGLESGGMDRLRF